MACPNKAICGSSVLFVTLHIISGVLSILAAIVGYVATKQCCATPPCVLNFNVNIVYQLGNECFYVTAATLFFLVYCIRYTESCGHTLGEDENIPFLPYTILLLFACSDAFVDAELYFNQAAIANCTAGSLGAFQGISLTSFIFDLILVVAMIAFLFILCLTKRLDCGEYDL